jgi:hypothetical protein
MAKDAADDKALFDEPEGELEMAGRQAPRREADAL